MRKAATLVVGGLLATSGGGVIAQDAATSQPMNLTTAAAPAGVSVPDSPAAADLFDKAAAKEQQQQWSAAGELDQQLLRKYAGRVVPAAVDADTGVFRYTGVARAVQDRVAHWPAEGLAVYRNAYGPAAADAFATANANAGSPDVAALQRLFTTAFVTDAGKTAGIELFDLLFESGRFDQAAAVGDRLLATHPALDVERPAVLFRTATARYRDGNNAAAQALLQQLRTRFAHETGVIAGRDVVLTDALAQQLATPAPQPHASASDADVWPTFSGPAEHGGVSSSPARAGASINRIELIAPSVGALDPANRALYQATEQAGPVQGEGINILPATDGHALFFQDGRHVYAHDLTASAPLPGWLATYPASTGNAGSAGGASGAGVYSLNLPGRSRGEPLTTTVTADAVLAIMGQPDPAPALSAVALLPPVPRVVCLERETGRLRWSVQAGDLPESAGNARNGDFAGPVRAVAPDIDPDAVLATIIGGRDRQFTESYLVCLSARTGKYRWSTYLGSATQTTDGEPTNQRPSDPLVTVAGTTAYVLSNVGTVVAVDVADGSIRWLNAYPRDAAETGDGNPNFFRNRLQGLVPPAEPKPWTLNPPIVSGGNVYVLPADGKALRIYDADTGVERQHIPTSDFDDVDVLLGVLPATPASGSTPATPAGVVLTTAKGVYCLDPAAYKTDDPGQAILWEHKDVAADQLSSADENTLLGRGFLTDKSVFLSTRHRLYQLDVRTGGKVVAMVPGTGSWGAVGANQPGNVLATASDVIVAGSNSLDVYADLDRVRQHFAELIRARPSDPTPRLALADALFNAGDTTAAMASLDEAIALVASGGDNDNGGSATTASAALPGGDGQRAVLAQVLSFARRSALAALPPEASESAGGTSSAGNPAPTFDAAAAALADSLFDRARHAAVSPPERIAYLLARAAFDHDRKDLAAEVLLCQQVLDDPATRRLSGGDAADEISTAIATDPAAYTPVQQQAEAALASATHAIDPAALLDVAAQFPNSPAASTALESAGSLEESRGDTAAAADALRHAFAGPGFSPTAAEANARRLVRIARDLAATPGGAAAAVDRLCAALRWRPGLVLTDPLSVPTGGEPLPAGTPATSAVIRLRSILEQQEESALPRLALEQPPSWASATLTDTAADQIPHVDNLLLPATRGDAPAAGTGRADRIVTVRAGSTQLAVFAPGSSLPRWTATLNDTPLNAAWLGDVLAVWSAHAVRLWNDAAGGAALPGWEINVLPADAAVASADPVSDAPTDDAGNNEVPPQFGGPRRFVVRNGVRIGIPMNGMLPGAVNVPVNFVGSAPPTSIGPTQIAGATVAGNQLIVSTSDGQLSALDGGGALAWHTRVDVRAPDHLLANGTFVLARYDNVGGSLLAVLDAGSGKLLGTRRFGPANSAGQLVNAALSEDGTLVFTVGNHLLSKDLYEPWALPPVDLVGTSAAPATPFTNLSGDRQLLVHLGRVIAAYDNGTFLRVHDLSAKNVAGGGGAGSAAAESDPRSTGSTTPVVALYTVGARVYALGTNSFVQYDLEHPADHYMPDPYDIEEPPHLQDLLLGQDYAIAIDQPHAPGRFGAVDQQPIAPAGFRANPWELTRFLAYSRTPVSASNPKESGKLEYAPARRDPAGLVAWQVVQGGICFLTNDGILHVVTGGS